MRLIKWLFKPNPNHCNRLIYWFGKCVFVGAPGISPIRIEEWIKIIGEKTDQIVDWHDMGGYVRVVALGNIRKVSDLVQGLRRKFPDIYECRSY